MKKQNDLKIVQDNKATSKFESVAKRCVFEVINCFNIFKSCKITCLNNGLIKLSFVD